MKLEDIFNVLNRIGFKNDDGSMFDKIAFHTFRTRMSFTKSINGKDFMYWFGPNTEGSYTMTKQATNFVSIRADGNTQIEILISGEFPSEYKEYKRDSKLNELGI